MPYMQLHTDRKMTLTPLDIREADHIQLKAVAQVKHVSSSFDHWHLAIVGKMLSGGGGFAGCGSILFIE